MNQTLHCDVFTTNGFHSAYESIALFVNERKISKDDIQFISEMLNGVVRMLWWSYE